MLPNLTVISSTSVIAWCASCLVGFKSGEGIKHKNIIALSSSEAIAITTAKQGIITLAF